MRLKMVVADGDKSYLEALEEYLISNYQHRFQLSFFSRTEYLEDMLSKENKALDILLISSEMFSKDLKIQQVKKVFILSNGKLDLDIDSVTIINKYQSCDALVTALMDVVSDGQLNNDNKFSKSNGKLITIYSPIGGSGKTTVAVATATLLAQMGRQVFYLNLEGISTMELYFRNESQYNLSNLYYFIKNRRKNISLKLEVMQTKDPLTEVAYLASGENPLEGEEINETDIEYMLTEFKESGLYDYIIIDLPSNLDTKTIQVMNQSHYVMMLINPNLVSTVKAQQFFSVIDKLPHSQENNLDKFIMVMNRCFSQHQEINIGEKQVKYQLPEDQEAWVKRGSQIILNSGSQFAKGVYKVIHDFEKQVD